jgi:hypothetical protein
MKEGPLAEVKLKRATPLDAPDATAARAATLPAAETPAAQTSPAAAVATLLHIDAALPVGARVGRRSLAFTGAFFAELLVHEAPAWMVSMVVHMVTLVTMAMVSVSEPIQYKPHQLLVTPPQRKVEEMVEVPEKPPTTLEENMAPAMVDLESKNEQEKSFTEPTDEAEAAPASTQITDNGLDHRPKGDITTPIGVYGGNMFVGRGMSGQMQKIKREGGNEASEAAVHKGLKWLAAHQMPDGGWSFDHTKAPGCEGQCRDAGKFAEARIAATGLALLPFLGRGDTHRNSERYKGTINAGLQFLVKQMRIGANGGALLENGGLMYSHGIASIALCEAYALSGDKNLLNPTRAALSFICYAQDPNGGGWRYLPRQKGDTSVVGWQLMALKSGYMAGFDIPAEVAEKAQLFLDSVQLNGGAVYGYTEPGQGEATTAIGLLCRMYLGWKRDNPALQRGVQMLSRRGPSPNNLYYNYYATQVMRHWEGEPWENWNRQMRDQLVHAQAKQGHEEGSWFTGGGDLGAPTGGRLYCTAMATMILEVYYRLMPIYRATSVDQDFPE